MIWRWARIVTNKPLDIAMDNKTVLRCWPITARSLVRRDNVIPRFLGSKEGYLVLDDRFNQCAPAGRCLLSDSTDGTIMGLNLLPGQRIRSTRGFGYQDATDVDLARREDGLFKPMNNTQDGQTFEPGTVASVTIGAIEVRTVVQSIR